VVPCSWRSPGPYELAHDNRDAIEAALSLARWTADRVREAPHLHLVVEPQLSVVAFTREGWDAGDYQRFSDQLLADQVGFVVPSNHDGKPILRCAFLHPETTTDMVAEVLDLL
jgi:glutamate/tyrosine decarboxylase-like PLP-dependent enzyme